MEENSEYWIGKIYYICVGFLKRSLMHAYNFTTLERYNVTSYERILLNKNSLSYVCKYNNQKILLPNFKTIGQTYTN